MKDKKTKIELIDDYVRKNFNHFNIDGPLEITEINFGFKITRPNRLGILFLKNNVIQS